MSEHLHQFIAQCRQRIDQALEHYSIAPRSPFAPANSTPYLQRLHKAINYSLLNGGKRIRPVLVYAASQAIASQTGINAAANAIDNQDKVACALEMIHAYSLIHDDLPAMDDDALRRGQPTCHIAFDEATAILAGDALQARAFELLTELHDCPAGTQLQLIQQLATASGTQGMVGGQAIDLFSVNKNIDVQQLETLHRMKTGALIRAAITMGATLTGASQEQLQALDQYGEAIGLAFQVQDDILDIESDTATLGKTQGADQALNKPTYPSLLGLPAAKQKARQLHEQALSALIKFDHRADTLREISAYIISRSH